MPISSNGCTRTPTAEHGSDPDSHLNFDLLPNGDRNHPLFVLVLVIVIVILPSAIQSIDYDYEHRILAPALGD